MLVSRCVGRKINTTKRIPPNAREIYGKLQGLHPDNFSWCVLLPRFSAQCQALTELWLNQSYILQLHSWIIESIWINWYPLYKKSLCPSHQNKKCISYVQHLITCSQIDPLKVSLKVSHPVYGMAILVNSELPRHGHVRSSQPQIFSGSELVISHPKSKGTPLKNISQNWNLPQVGMKIKKWNHHLGFIWVRQGSPWLRIPWSDLDLLIPQTSLTSFFPMKQWTCLPPKNRSSMARACNISPGNYQLHGASDPFQSGLRHIWFWSP